MPSAWLTMYLAKELRGISDLITVAGMINVDFADVKTIMN
jgi:cell division GTPase FtsZ